MLLDRYIAKVIIQAIVVVMLLIMGLVMLLSMLAELKNLGQGDYRLLQLFAYVFMRLPSELYHFSPIIVLLGTISGLGVLARTNELIVMRALGMATHRIILSITFAAFLMVTVIAMIGETAGPKLSAMAVMQKQNARSAGHAIVTGSGVWFHIGNDFIHIKQIISKHLLQGVTRYEFDKKLHLIAVYAADKLIFKQNGWHLDQVKKTSFFNDGTKAESLAILPWSVNLNTDLFNDIIEPSEMSLKKLVQFSHYLKQNDLQASQYEFAFWQRVAQPFVDVIMVLIALPFAFSISYRNQYAKQLLAGTFLGIALFISNSFLEQVCIIYQFPAWVAAILPLVILCAISYYFLRRFLFSL